MSVLGPALPADPSLTGTVPLERVRVEPERDSPACPPAFRPFVLVDAIHDGNQIPAEFLSRAPSGHWEELLAGYAEQRDWGSSMVAGYLASALHLPGFMRVNTARALIDYNRFPGVSSEESHRLDRLAIDTPFDRWLDPVQQQHLLESHYDVIGEGFEAMLPQVRLHVSIHTFDERDPLGRLRPPISLVSRAQLPASPLGTGALSSFDPLFPSELLESTSDRLLRVRLAHALEDGGFHVTENFPYLMSEGSFHVRTIAWRFFERVRAAFELLHPARQQIGDVVPRDLVWDMLLDTDQRSSTSELLRSHLHRLSRPPPGRERVFDLARSDYHRIRDFVAEHRQPLVHGLSRSHEQVSTLMVEIRKDLIWKVVEGPFGSPLAEPARAIANALARGIRDYLVDDRPDVVEDAVSREGDRMSRRSVGQ